MFTSLFVETQEQGLDELLDWVDGFDYSDSGYNLKTKSSTNDINHYDDDDDWSNPASSMIGGDEDEEESSVVIDF